MTTTTKTIAARYGIMISTGNGPFRHLAGWDEEFTTRHEAKECAARASKHDGWAAKVVRLSAAR